MLPFRDNSFRSTVFLLLHGNGVGEPEKIAAMVRQTRRVEGYCPMPILFNEDDHFAFDQPVNNFTAAISEWGYFDYRFEGNDITEGYQSVPVDWGISHPRKKGFFERVKRITGAG